MKHKSEDYKLSAFEYYLTEDKSDLKLIKSKIIGVLNV